MWQTLLPVHHYFFVKTVLQETKKLLSHCCLPFASYKLGAGSFQLWSISLLINRAMLLDACLIPSAAGVRYLTLSRPLVILTHQRAESHHSQKSLQKNPKGVHQSAILTAPVIRTCRRAGGHRGVGKGHSGHPCSTLTCQWHVSEVGGHVDTTNSIHRTEQMN